MEAPGVVDVGADGVESLDQGSKRENLARLHIDTETLPWVLLTLVVMKS